MRTNKRPRNSDAARRKALADATAGVIGSLASVVAFYPVDVWKTSLMAAGVTAEENKQDDRPSAPTRRRSQSHPVIHRRPSIQSIASNFLPLSRLFRGLPHKMVHTIVSSFTYFFVYSLVQTKYATYRRSLLSSRNVSSASSPASNNTTSMATKLLLTAFAAVINTGITLPLDTISSRKQAGTSSSNTREESEKGGSITVTNHEKEKNGSSSFIPSYEHLNGNSNESDNSLSDDDDDDSSGFSSARGSFSEEYHSANEDDDVQGNDCSPNEGSTSTLHQNSIATLGATASSSEKRRHQLYIKSPEKYKFSFSTNLAEEAFASRANSTIDDDSNDDIKLNNKKQNDQQLKSILSLWNGLFPAILLCTNPAIQYTMFDTLKNSLLQHRLMGKTNNSVGSGAANEAQKQQPQQSNKLSMWDAFIFGLISKFFATIITYPLIRCKVLLMVSSPDAFVEGEKNNTCSCEKSEKEENCCNGIGIGRNTMKQQQTRTCPSSSSSSSDKKYPRSLPLLLIHIFRNDGIRGIYKGCSLQLLHTILKSALLMMVREKITSASHGFFQVDDG
ncbi:hypothetical protein ACHAXR_007564 [Thalassiosira sp. AJA248-18]